MTPIIIHTTREVDCIVESGIRYCENQPITSTDAGLALLVAVGLLLWVVGVFLGAEQFFPHSSGVATLIGILVPLTILALFLIF